ncbi:MAG: fluoride efflux transporter CrcB [Chloroflexi bacterium]|nr:fluoride efflux transporter CrcB [Chloroflexota bacterium]
MGDLLWVGVGGGLGSIARYTLGAWLVGRLDLPFPYHTLLINVTGSFLIGIILGLLLDYPVIDPIWRLLLVVGFLGGYTTFSTFTAETMALLVAGKWVVAFGYLVMSNGFGLLAVAGGSFLVRALGR